MGWVILSHALLGMWLFIQAGIKMCPFDVIFKMWLDENELPDKIK